MAFAPTKWHLRDLLYGHYIQGMTAAESRHIIWGMYPAHVPNEKTCRKWFARFKSGDINIRDKKRCGRVKKFDDSYLETLIEENPCQSQNQLAARINADQTTISRRLKKLNFIQKDGRWVRNDSNQETEQTEMNDTLVSDDL